MNFPRALSSHTHSCDLHYLPTQAEYKAMMMLSFTCECCGFVGCPTKEVPSGGMEFVNVNGKLTLLCMMCAQSQLLTRPVLLGNGGNGLNHGALIYCPDVTQGKIISITRDIYALALYQQNNQNRKLRIYIEELRESYLSTVINRCANIPALKIQANHISGYASLYKYASDNLLSHEKAIFGGIRYIPDETIYSHIVKYWLNTSYKAILAKF